MDAEKPIFMHYSAIGRMPDGTVGRTGKTFSYESYDVARANVGSDVNAFRESSTFTEIIAEGITHLAPDTDDTRYYSYKVRYAIFTDGKAEILEEVVDTVIPRAIRPFQQEQVIRFSTPEIHQSRIWVIEMARLTY